MKILVDTNVILDAVTHREPFNLHAEKIFLLCAQEKIEGLISATAITDIYYVARKYFKDNTLAKDVISKLCNIFTICDITKNDIEKALKLPISDYEDAVIVSCAQRTKCKYIITRNVSDFANAKIPVLYPEDFLLQVL